MRYPLQTILLATMLGTVLAGSLGKVDASPAKAGLFSSWSVGLVRQAHAAGLRYLDVQHAIDDGYVLATGCVSNGGPGAMGVHYVNLALLGDDQVDPDHPEALVYEPNRYGGMTLVAVEYMLFSDAWHASNETPPVIRGQAMNLIGAPNRYAIPAFYELHVWAFRDNPDGVFSNFNRRVTCENYDPPA